MSIAEINGATSKIETSYMYNLLPTKIIEEFIQPVRSLLQRQICRS